MCRAMEELRNEAMEEGRLRTIICFLINGGTKEDAKQYLQATEDEMKKAEEMLISSSKTVR